MLKRLFSIIVALSFVLPFGAAAASLSMTEAYKGKVQLPEFNGRDRAYANYRSRIIAGIKAGPNFAGHYAFVEIGCGTSCRFAFVADVATGQVFSFPFGGENYYMLQLQYSVRSPVVLGRCVEVDACWQDRIEWDGKAFHSREARAIGPRSLCE